MGLNFILQHKIKSISLRSYQPTTFPLWNHLYLLSCTAVKQPSLTPSFSRPASVGPSSQFYFMSHQPTQAFHLYTSSSGCDQYLHSGTSAGPSRPVSHHKNKHFKRSEVSVGDILKCGWVNSAHIYFGHWGALYISSPVRNLKKASV